jgi:hypothetical protein
MLCLAEPLDFGALSKHPNEVLRVLLDFGSNLTRYREPGRLYHAGESVRPRVPTGWAYEAVADGTSAHHEPTWLTGENSITRDGSMQWRAIPASHNAIDVIVNATWIFDDVAVSVSGVSWQGAELVLNVQGGSDGHDYQGTVTIVTLSGQTLVGVFVVKARTKRVA